MSNIFSSPLVLESVFRDVFRDVFDEGSAYAVAGFDPALVFDFDDEYYRTGGSTSTFSSAITQSRTSNATMVDSDGLLKWAPHNLLTYSQDLTSAAWALISNVTATGGESDSDGGSSANLLTPTGSNWYIGQSIPSTAATITVAAWVKAASGSSAGFRLFCNGGTTNSSNLTATDSFQLFTFEAASTASGQCGVRDASPSVQEAVIVYGLHAYRSDLGGMVNNPDRGDSYVPTTSSARYLARRGHHIWNGSAWVNEGMLHESEARTNKITQSNNLATGWTIGSLTYAQNANGPLGAGTAYTITVTAGASSHWWFISTGAATGDQASSSFAKAGTANFLCIASAGAATDGVWFDLSTGTVGTENGSSYGLMEDFGGGWYRCTAIIPGATFQTAHACVSDGQLQNFTAAGTETIFWCGAQVETGSTPSSYIPTSGATVTRAADTLTVPSANLPWPTPNVIGPELVTNGGFDTASDWTLTDTAISGGVLSLNLPTTTGTAIQDVSAVSGSVYRVTLSISGRTTGDVDVGLSAYSPGLNITSNGETSFIQVATGSVLNVRFQNSFDGTIDNISVREIDPLAVSIQMQGRMTYADTNVATEAIFYRWLFDGNNQIQARLDTTSTDTGQVQFYSIANTVVDVVESSATAYSPGVNVSYNIASRHGSTFINGAVDGTALTANTTPVALPDLSATDLNLGFDYMGTIKLFRIWAADLADAGIAEAST